eukprot:1330779-Amorphochlora_amoeboformis.AAC.1
MYVCIAYISHLDIDLNQSATDALQQQTMKIGEAIYKSSGSSGSTESKDQTMDAEYEEKKNQEKQ